MWPPSPFLLQAPLMSPLAPLWPGQAQFYTVAPGQKRNVEEYLHYPDLENAMVKRQKLCGN